MNYFEELIQQSNLLTAKAQAYLDTLPFTPNDEVCQRIFNVATKIFQDNNEDFTKVPEWVAQTMDYCIPFSVSPRNGSLKHSLGYSVVAQDANLRMLMEHAEGRCDSIEYFDTIPQI